MRSSLLWSSSSSHLLLLLLRHYLYLSNFFLLSKATSQHDAPRQSQRGLREVRNCPVRGLRNVRYLLFGRGFRLRFLCLLGFGCLLFIVKRHFLDWHLLLLLLRSLGLATLAFVVLLLGLRVVLVLIIVVILAPFLCRCLSLLIRGVSCLLLKGLRRKFPNLVVCRIRCLVERHLLLLLGAPLTLLLLTIICSILRVIVLLLPIVVIIVILLLLGTLLGTCKLASLALRSLPGSLGPGNLSLLVAKSLHYLVVYNTQVK